jgi:hypothetical protein
MAHDWYNRNCILGTKWFMLGSHPFFLITMQSASFSISLFLFNFFFFKFRFLNILGKVEKG